MAISLPNTNNGGTPLTTNLGSPDLNTLGSAFDIDKDGKLSDAEQSGLESFLKSNDGNNDGKLDDTELTTAKNKSGKLTAEEKNKYIKDASTPTDGKYDTYYAHGQGHTPNMDDLDRRVTDNRDEYSVLLKNQLISKFDKNKDGKLTGAERGASEKYLSTINHKGKFGHDDAKSALKDLKSITPDSVEGYFQQAKQAAGGEGGKGEGGNSNGGKGGLYKEFSREEILAMIPPEYRHYLEAYLP